MAKILITSGPTRQYLDPVRYLTNASSGRMGKALAEAALARGHEVVVVSGPVDIAYPAAVRVTRVVSTEEMLEACQDVFPDCDGLIGVAAPSDYRPVMVAQDKITKTGQPLLLHLIETADVLASLGEHKTHQWLVGFALETADHRLRALAKLEKKHCDLVVLNGTNAMNSPENEVEIIDPSGNVVQALAGPKEQVGRGIFEVIQRRLIDRRVTCDAAGPCLVVIGRCSLLLLEDVQPLLAACGRGELIGPIHSRCAEAGLVGVCIELIDS